MGALVPRSPGCMTMLFNPIKTHSGVPLLNGVCFLNVSSACRTGWQLRLAVTGKLQQNRKDVKLRKIDNFD